MEQTVGVSVDIDALSGSGNSPIYSLVARTLNVPRAQVVLKCSTAHCISYLRGEEFWPNEE